MQKVKKIVIYCLLMLVVMVFLPNLSMAEAIPDPGAMDRVANSKSSNEYDPVLKGGRLFTNYSVLRSRNDLYCIEHGGKLSSANRYFHITNFIKIDGNTATNTKGQSVTDKRNGTLAYVIAQKQGYGSVGNYTDGQKAIYHLIYDWIVNVGSKLGVSTTLYNYDGSKAYPANSLVTAGRNYANQIDSITGAQLQATSKDNTDKSKIRVTQFTENNTQYLRVGPFNWSFSGTLTSLTVKADGGKQIAVTATKFVGNQEVKISVNQIKSGEDFYIVFPVQNGISKITNVSGIAKINGSQVNKINAYLWFMSPRTNTDSGPAYNYQNLLLTNADSAPIGDKEIPVGSDYDINLIGPLGILKVDADDNSKVLEGIGFIVQKATGEYVKTENGNISYVSEREQATTFLTNSEGKIAIEGLLLGNYTVTEVVNPYDEYEIGKMNPVTITVKASATVEYTVVTNRKEYIKLSGYVWLDTTNEKMSVRNDLYKEEEYESDELMAGVTVRLKSKTTGEVIKNPITGKEQIAITNSNGEYLFEKILIDEVSDYYVEFEYDGLVYSNVTPHLDKDNGGKASEGEFRKAFDDKFAEVKGKDGVQDVVEVKDENGNTQYEISYDRHPESAESTIRGGQSFPIISTTQNAGYIISYDRATATSNEIKNINLGLYIRPQADMALMQDMEEVKVSINGYDHIYKYANRFDNMNAPVEDAWNVGVKFASQYGEMTYTRPIYKADAEFDNGPDESLLHVSMTYKIALKNEASIVAKINSISDYFDSRYELNAVGTGIDEKGNITGELKTSDVKVGQSYNRVDIYTNEILQPSEVKYLYVQFNLSRANVLELLNNEQFLKNVSEITSYTSYYDANATQLYAALDKDSVPDNATPGDKTTYEDDTDAAPGIQLVIANARQISGSIFEDNVLQDLLEQKNIRQGDEKFDENTESKIGGVVVQLLKVNDNGEVTDEVAKVYDEITGQWTGAECATRVDSNGDYTISGYLPGKYAIKFTWGEGIYKIVNGTEEVYTDVVENYKSTVINKQRYDEENTNLQFYKNSQDIRQSHAIDDYATRQEIDTLLNGNGYNYKTQVSIKQISSLTPKMEFMVEYEDTDLEKISYHREDDKLVFEVKNMDFGIVRRAIQNVKLEKSVSRISITLANGQTIVDAEIDENGNMTGQTDYLTHIGPTEQNGIIIENGFLRAEMDSEIIQGSTVRMEYRLTTYNTSEADYMSEGYYKYGDGWYDLVQNGAAQRENDIIAIAPSKIIDYLDDKSVYIVQDQVNIDNKWRELTIDDLKTEELIASNIAEALEKGKYIDENGEEQELKLSQLYITDVLKDTYLKPLRVVNNEAKVAESADVYIAANKVLSSSEDSNFGNQAEIILLSKPGGSKPIPTPGNYIPNNNNQETDDSTAEEILVVPSTGSDQNYIIPITVGVMALVILGVGIVVIKKKVLDK